MAERRQYSEEVDSKILELQASGMKRKDIAQTLDIPLTKVHKLLGTRGIKLTKDQRRANIHSGRQLTVTQYPEGTTDKILELHKNGISRPDIAKQLGLDINKVISDIQLYSTHKLTKEQLSDIRSVLEPELVKNVIKLRQDGETFKKIGEVFNIKPKQAEYICIKNNIKLTKNQVKDIAREYDRSELAPKIRELKLVQLKENETVAKELGISAATVKRVSREFGLFIPKDLLASRYEIPKETADRIIELRKKGVKRVKIAELTGINQDKVNKFLFENQIVLTDEQRTQNGLSSHHEEEIRKLVKSWTGEAYSTRNVIKPYELDIYVPGKNIAIEYNGLHFHSEVYGKDEKYHLNKLELCEKQGIRLISIFSDEYLNKRMQVIGFLKSIFKHEITSLGARELEVRIGRVDDVKVFLDANHLQGSAGHVAISLWKDGTCYATGTFRKSSRQRKGALEEGYWEMTRYCVKIGFAVPGGFERIIKHFKASFNAKTIVTYADRRWSRGDIYKKAGFQLDATLPPNYWYVKRNSDTQRFHKAKFRKERIEANFGPLLENETEKQAMERLGYSRIHDCGLQRWILNF